MMAEVAPLTVAHAHARKAAEYIADAHFDQAAEEHQNAAVHFARASRGTSDSEALRILNLLEQQHRRLANIIKSQDPPEDPEAAPNTPSHVKAAQPAEQIAATSSPSSNTSSSKPSTPTTALAASRVSSQTRDSSPSLARDIASRRGIPPLGTTRPSPAAQARARQLSPESRRRTRSAMSSSSSSSSSRIPPSIVESQADLRARRSKKAEQDEGFTKFYSNLTTGTMSKLSSALAYAGLPLTAEDAQSTPTPPPPPLTTSKNTSARGTNEPDVHKLFSKAALAAIEDEHRQRGTLGTGFGPAESFYVVSPHGGTATYAHVASGPTKRSSDEDDFVDAREEGTSQRKTFGAARTEEELELENATMKATIDQLARRLQQFEVHAQDASMAALTHSMASLRGGGTTVGGDERVRQLEQQIEREVESREKLEAHAVVQERKLKKWAAQYSKLKESAREKMKAKETAGKGAGEGDVAAGEEAAAV